MKTFVELKKNVSKAKTCEYPCKKIAVLGNSATQLLTTALKGYAFEEQLKLDIFDADYNQIKAQIIDNNSELYAFSPNYLLLFMCSEKLYETFCSTPLEARSSFATSLWQEICGYWEAVNSRIKTDIIMFTFTEADDCIFGNYSAKLSESFLFQVKKLNLMLMEGSRENKNVYLIDINQLFYRYGYDAVFDDKIYYTAKMTLSVNIIPYVAKQIIDMIKATMGIIKKCVILDLDNTIWGGVIGDDGIDGIEIGELGQGHVFTDFQTWLKELKKRGIILAVCSKNNEDTAKEPFVKHPEMVLRLEDISIFVANWNDKPSNIKFIRDTLNIGMDSIIFFDDNPFERNMVRQAISEITVPELPEDPAKYLNYIKSLNLFETASFSNADVERTDQYRAEAGRAVLQQQYESYDEYLKELEMIADVKHFDKFSMARVAQLTQRSNQFNLRTVRYTESEIEEIAKNDHYITMYFTLADKYGNHGLISVVILEKKSSEELFIYEWLMSCRVLKRGMEEFIINSIINVARNESYKRVAGEYIKTPKNSMVEHIYKQMGFEESGCISTADTESFISLKTFISKSDDSINA